MNFLLPNPHNLLTVRQMYPGPHTLLNVKHLARFPGLYLNINTCSSEEMTIQSMYGQVHNTWNWTA